MGETPFALVHRVECMIPTEVEFPGVLKRLLPEQEDSNNLMLLDELDLTNERETKFLYESKTINRRPQSTLTLTYAPAVSKKAT